MYPGIVCDYYVVPSEVSNLIPGGEISCECLFITGTKENGVAEKLWICQGNGWESDLNFHEGTDIDVDTDTYSDADISTDGYTRSADVNVDEVHTDIDIDTNTNTVSNNTGVDVNEIDTDIGTDIDADTSAISNNSGIVDVDVDEIDNSGVDIDVDENDIDIEIDTNIDSNSSDIDNATDAAAAADDDDGPLQPTGEDTQVELDSESCPDGFPVNGAPCTLSGEQKRCGPYELLIPDNNDSIIFYQVCLCGGDGSGDGGGNPSFLFECRIDLARPQPQIENAEIEDFNEPPITPHDTADDPAESAPASTPPTTVPTSTTLESASAIITTESLSAEVREEPTKPTNIINGPINTDDARVCPMNPPDTYDECAGSSTNGSSKLWTQCIYAIQNEYRTSWVCNCGPDLRFNCKPRGSA